MSDIPKCMDKKTFSDLALKFHEDKNTGCRPGELILTKQKMQKLLTNKKAQIEKYGSFSEESLDKCNKDQIRSSYNADKNAASADNNDNNKCIQSASLLSTVPPECTIPGPQPQIKELMEAAFQYPAVAAAEAAAEVATDVLKNSGNKALVEIATKKALGLEDANMLNELSKDPIVAAELEKFKGELGGVVEKSIGDVSKTIKEPIENAAKELATGVITAGTTALASVSGPLVPLATIAGTAGQLVNEATAVVDAVKDAEKDVSHAMSQVTDVQNAIDDAAKRAKDAANAAIPSIPNVEVPKISEVNVTIPNRIVPPNYDRVTFGPNRNDFPAGEEGYAEYEKAQEAFQEQKKKNRATEATKATEAKKSTLPKLQSGPGVVPEQIITNEPQSASVGGSRKRRRIHKLSRRIERTLRRVQKKYGLRDDKNSFLRRTLRSNKP
jgi:hypothetical protein